jgi:hypothetical protein
MDEPCADVMATTVCDRRVVQQNVEQVAQNCVSKVYNPNECETPVLPLEGIPLVPNENTTDFGGGNYFE